jgi:hypothetical protein
MLPGPDQIVACPACGGLAKYATLLSGNTFGARLWTDGKQEAPMLPQPPAVVKCRHCGGCYWLADAERVGELDVWGADPLAPDEAWPLSEDHPLAVPESWRTAQYVEEPEEAEYYAALRSGLAQDRQQERALRIFAWWRSNDPSRDGEESSAGGGSEPAAREENLRALLPLLEGEEDRNRIMRAEVLRELGRWGEAEAALLRVRSREFAAAVRQIEALCRARDRAVRELMFE